MTLIEKAKAEARRNIEKLYEDVCTVYRQKEVFDATTKRTKNEPVKAFENQPCKLSFSSLNANSQPEPVAEMRQTVKLFICPELDIEPGCRIDVVHKGRIISYQRSGMPAVYDTHQEIMLEPFERWA